jgi:hypothetical protein
VSAALILLTLDIAAMLSAALLGARLLLGYPRRRSAQLIALICVCNISYIALSRYDCRYWIPGPFHFEVGAWLLEEPAHALVSPGWRFAVLLPITAAIPGSAAPASTPPL